MEHGRSKFNHNHVMPVHFQIPSILYFVDWLSIEFTIALHKQRSKHTEVLECSIYDHNFNTHVPIIRMQVSERTKRRFEGIEAFNYLWKVLTFYVQKLMVIRLCNGFHHCRAHVWPRSIRGIETVICSLGANPRLPRL